MRFRQLLFVAIFIIMWYAMHVLINLSITCRIGSLESSYVMIPFTCRVGSLENIRIMRNDYFLIESGSHYYLPNRQLRKYSNREEWPFSIKTDSIALPVFFLCVKKP